MQTVRDLRCSRVTKSLWNSNKIINHSYNNVPNSGAYPDWFIDFIHWIYRQLLCIFDLVGFPNRSEVQFFLLDHPWLIIFNQKLQKSLGTLENFCEDLHILKRSVHFWELQSPSLKLQELLADSQKFWKLLLNNLKNIRNSKNNWEFSETAQKTGKYFINAFKTSGELRAFLREPS